MNAADVAELKRLRDDMRDPDLPVMERMTARGKFDVLLNHHADDLIAAAAECDRLRLGIKAVDALIAESSGVTGLHLNGDVAPWTELRTGGRFEEWLHDFDAALEDKP